ncbi:hypothetical protein D3C80_1519700 [compost metagenome]
MLQRLAQWVEFRVVACTLAGCGDQADQLLEPGTLVLGQLATEQVERLDAFCTLVDRVQAVVPVVLLYRVFAGVAVATENLDCQFVGLEAERRRPGLDDRGQ